jgi:hypothetical protein
MLITKIDYFPIASYIGNLKLIVISFEHNLFDEIITPRAPHEGNTYPLKHSSFHVTPHRNFAICA